MCEHRAGELLASSHVLGTALRYGVNQQRSLAAPGHCRIRHLRPILARLHSAIRALLSNWAIYDDACHGNGISVLMKRHAFRYRGLSQLLPGHIAGHKHRSCSKS